MPNPKVGTVTPDVAERGAGTPRPARSATAPTRPASSTARIGKAAFAPDQLQENLHALHGRLSKVKPATSKGVYLEEGHGVHHHGAGRQAVDQATPSFDSSRSVPGTAPPGRSTELWSRPELPTSVKDRGRHQA
ncbi:MAG: hypothetical protein MZV65_46235 [Chromatiales bacterium]|nr:hypothetical protein [Chromatiales bacterium]